MYFWQIVTRAESNVNYQICNFDSINEKEKIQSCICIFSFSYFFFIEKISGDSILLTQKERCPKRYPNLFLRDSFCRGLSQWRFRWGYFKSLFFEGRFCQGLSHNHRVEFFEPIFFLKFVTFLPLTFAKTFFRPWELLPLIYIYIYITETSETLTIFLVTIIFFFFLFQILLILGFISYIFIISLQSVTILLVLQ